jgi:uncharacterized protein (DUF2147 family)
MTKTFVLCLIAWAFITVPSVAQPTNGALGIWSDEDGKSNIEIAPCGAYLCGRIVWLKEPNDETGQPKRDVNNPNASDRTQPIMGMTIIKGLRPDEDNKQLKGQVYNAEDGKVYDLYLTPRSTTMEVEGCFAYVLCGSQIWNRVQ